MKDSSKPTYFSVGFGNLAPIPAKLSMKRRGRISPKAVRKLFAPVA